MAHIPLDETLPGMRSLLAYRPAIAPAMTSLMEVLMRSDAGLSKGERELIGAMVSSLNDCFICHQIHGEIAQCFFDNNRQLIQQVKESYMDAPITARLKAILAIAASVQESGKAVSSAQVEAARNEGVSDMEIHDTVLIAAMFCMFNRYIDGLGVVSKDTPESFRERASMIAQMGYDHK